MTQVGSAWIQVTPSLRGFNQRVRQQLRREMAGVSVEVKVEANLEGVQREASRKGGEAGGEFAQSFRRRVEAALKSLPDVKIDADSTPAQREIAALREELRTLGEKTVGIDLDAGEALAQIERLKARLAQLGAETPSIDVEVDAAAAAGQLEAIEREAGRLDGRHVEVNVDVDRGGGAQAAFSILTSRVTGLVSAGALIGPAFIPALGAATFGVLGLASAAAGASAGIGVLAAAVVPAIMNVTDAITAQEQAEKATATSAITTTRQRVQAAYQAQQAAQRTADAQQQADRTAVQGSRQVQDAQRALGETRRDVAQRIEDATERIGDADRRVVDSERTLERAHAAVQRAQEDLTRAREDAIRTLQDLREEESDLTLSQEGAEIALIEARQDLAKANRSSTATLLDRRKAALDVKLAEDRLSDVQRDQVRTREELNDAERAGVNGSEQVLSANERLADSQRGVADAQRGLADAERGRTEAQRDLARAEADGARTIAAAERSLSDARTQAAQANADAARAVADAMQAQAQQAEAANLQAENGITANRNLAYQLGLLTPLQRELYDGFNHLRDAFEGWAESLEPDVIPLLLQGMGLIEDLLPRLTPLVHAAADAFGILLDKASRALQAPFWQEFFDFLARTAGQALIDTGTFLGNIATGFAAILMAFEPMADRVTGGLVDLSERFRNWATSLDAQTIADLWDRITKAGERFTDGLVRLWEDGIKPFLKSPEFKDFFRAWEDFRRRVWDKLIDELVFFLENVAPPLLDFMTRVLKFLIYLDDHTGGAVTGLAALAAVLGIIGSIPGVGAVLGALTSGLAGLVGTGPLTAVVAGLAELVLWTGFVIDHWGEWVSAIPLFTGPIGIAAFVLGGLIKNFDTLKEKMGQVLDWVRDNWRLLPILLAGPIGVAILLIIAHWETIKNAFFAAWHWVRDNVLKPMGDYWHDKIYPRFAAARDFIGRVWEQVKGAFASAWHWVRDEVLKPFALYWEQKIFPKIRAARDFFGRVWEQIRKTAGAAWDRITDVIRGAVNIAIRIINKVIGAINAVASGLGIDVHIDKITELRDSNERPAQTSGGRRNQGPGARTAAMAAGGVVPSVDLGQSGPFVTAAPRAIVGEGSRVHPEFVIPTDPKFRARALDLFGRLGTQLMASGGTTRPRGPGIAGLYPPLATAVAQVIQRAHGAVSISSGWRSSEQQARLYHEYRMGRGNLAARPGSSQHEGGNAVDFGGNQSLYTRLASQLGLVHPVSGEPWHWEKPGQGRAGGGGIIGSGVFGSVAEVVQKIIDAASGIGDIKLKLVRGAANWVKNKAAEWAKRKAVELFEPITGSAGGIGRAYLEGSGLGGTAAANRLLGQQMNAARGWGRWWRDLDSLVMSESGWRSDADNPTSTAYGIGQFLDSTWGSVGYRKSSAPGIQIAALLDYIDQRYDNPANAWAFKRSHNYYAMGGILPFLGSYQTGLDRVPHDGLAFLHRDEAVLDSGDAAMFRQAGLDSVKGGRTYEQHNVYTGIVDPYEISRQTSEDLAWLATVGSH